MNNQNNPQPNGSQLRFAVLATDVTIWTLYNNELYIRLVNVNLPPFYNNRKGLPGGLIKPEEEAEQAAQRLISDKAGLDFKKLYAEQLYTFSTVNRDPRGRVVSVAYTAFVPWQKLSVSEQGKGNLANWCKFSDLPQLAYDHNQIIQVSLQRLQSKITYTNLISKLMPTEFTLTDLEKAYEIILQKQIDKRNFRKKILSINVVSPLQKFTSGLKSRPAQLYKFKDRKIININMV